MQSILILVVIMMIDNAKNDTSNDSGNNSWCS